MKLAQAAPQPYRLLLLGDTSFGESYQERRAEKGLENILESRGYDYSLELLLPILRRADMSIANLETPVSNLRPSPFAGRKNYLHWADVRLTPATLKSSGITAVSLANNHALDRGVQGLQETLTILQAAGITAFGAGMNEQQASQPLKLSMVTTQGEQEVLVVGGFEYRENYARKYDYYAGENQAGIKRWASAEVISQFRELRSLNPKAFIVAFPHWGKNYAWRTTDQQHLAHSIIDAGADLIVGHGAHQMQEIEQYRGRWIVYGLGNFVFNSPGRYVRNNSHAFSLIAQLELLSATKAAAGLQLKLYPIYSDNRKTDYLPRHVTDLEFDLLKSLLASRVVDSANSLPEGVSAGEDSAGLFFSLLIR